MINTLHSQDPGGEEEDQFLGLFSYRPLFEDIPNQGETSEAGDLPDVDLFVID